MPETIEFQVPLYDKDPLSLSISSADVLFILGANGTGKSNLMHRFFAAHFDKARRISAHRQTWFSSNEITLSPGQKRATQTNIQNQDRDPNSRFLDPQGANRPGIAIFDLIDAQNVRARAIATSVDDANTALSNLLSTEKASTDIIRDLLELSKEKAPIAVINELLRLSNLPIVISVRENEQVLASKSGSEPYSIAELSDGERNAILIAAEVLTAKSNTLILVDEPERHLHRSIISPLLTQLFAKRDDCAFVISTHEVMLPLDNPSAKTLLVRGCTYEGKQVRDWEADLVSGEAEIDEELKKDILGARRKILFVEGTQGSLDKPLYSLVFPKVSVVPKASCKDVEQAVAGIRGADNLHWVHAFGIVDNDGRDDQEMEQLKERGIYALAVFSVESVYYHPKMQQLAAEGHAKVTGEDALTLLEIAKTAAIKKISESAPHLVKRTAARILREQLFKHIPGKTEIAVGEAVDINLDISGVVENERAALDKAIKENDLSLLIARYPVRETGALSELASKLRFKDRRQYESTVRSLLIDDEKSLHFVRSLFGALSNDISVD